MAYTLKVIKNILPNNFTVYCRASTNETVIKSFVTKYLYILKKYQL